MKGSVAKTQYDANGNRDQKTVTTGGSNPTTYQVNDTYQNGRLEAYTWEVRVRYTLRQGQAAGEIAARTAA